MPKSYENEPLDSTLRTHLEALRDVPARDAETAKRARSAFLSEAQRLAVSYRAKQRLNGWKALWMGIIPRKKEVSPMFSALTTVLLIVSLLLGGGGVTVAAAQSSQPDSWLYPLKVWSEDLRSDLTYNQQARLALMLDLSEQRTQEITAMVERGEVPPDPVLLRLQTHLQNALQLALAQDDAQAVQALERIRSRLEVQYQRLLLHASPANPTAQAVLQRTRAMIQAHLQAVEEGLNDPQRLRERLRQGAPFTPGPLEEMPQQPGKPGQGGNPWTEGTPTPGSGYGEGQGGNPWTEGTPTPGSGYGEGQGGNPWTEGTPTPGSGYGPGPGPDATCTAPCGHLAPTPMPQPGNGRHP